MVTLYDAARALLKKVDSKPPTSENSTGSAKSTSTNKSTDKKPDSKSTGSGKQIKNKLSDIEKDAEKRGTSMEDLMAEKQRREKEKAGKAAPEQKAK